MIGKKEEETLEITEKLMSLILIYIYKISLKAWIKNKNAKITYTEWKLDIIKRFYFYKWADLFSYV